MRHFLKRAIVKPLNLAARLPAVVFPCLCISLHSHKMELTSCVPNPDFGVLEPDQQFSESYQGQWFVPEFAGVRKAAWNNITTLYDHLGHTLCKGPLLPNSSLQRPLFSDFYSPYDDISDGSFHNPNSYEMFSRFYPCNSYRRISKDYLVRR